MVLHDECVGVSPMELGHHRIGYLVYDRNSKFQLSGGTGAE